MKFLTAFLCLALTCPAIAKITPGGAYGTGRSFQEPSREDKIMSGEITLETAKSSVGCEGCGFNWTWISQDGMPRQYKCRPYGHMQMIYQVRYDCPRCGYTKRSERREKYYTVRGCDSCDDLQYCDEVRQ